MKKRLAWMAITLAALAAAWFTLAQLLDRREEAQAVCDGFMAGFSPPLPRFQSEFTPFLNRHPTAGEVVGFKPGWIIGYRDLVTGSSITYYADLSGAVVHSEPVDWMGALEKWRKATPAK